MTSLAAALEAMGRGDFRPGSTSGLLPQGARALFRPALDTARWLAGDEKSPPQVATYDPSVRGAAAAAQAAHFAQLAHAHLLRLDASAIAGLPSCVATDEPELELAFDAARAVALAFVGPLDAVSVDALARRASQASAPSVRVEATVVRALHALWEGKLDHATSFARRASRMARTEALPQPEYLANVVLARTRRLRGHPHLAARILSALLKIAPAPWRPLIAWEITMASGLDAEPFIGGASNAHLARALIALLRAAEAGERPQFDRGASDLALSLAGFGLLERDLGLACLALDPWTADAEAERAVRDFRCGGSTAVPAAVMGLAPHAASNQPLAGVAIRADGAACRVLLSGLPLLEGGPPLGEVLESAASAGRSESLLCALALAGPAGVSEEEAFIRTYGFPYQRELHRGVFGVLIHRARARLGDVGDLERDEGMLRLRMRTPMALPDPRCTRTAEDRALQLMASRSSTNAKEVAADLGVSLRSAQQTLQALVDAGLCERAREGRAIIYHVEDTTFQEPTQHG